jgi:DNA-directed RNA polymerase subunit RPC12/RpoP
MPFVEYRYPLDRRCLNLFHNAALQTWGTQCGVCAFPGVASGRSIKRGAHSAKFLTVRHVGMPLRHILSTVVDISATFPADNRNRLPNAASCVPITEAAFRFLATHDNPDPAPCVHIVSNSMIRRLPPRKVSLIAHFARGRVEKLKPISRMFEKETIEVTCKICGHEGQESVANLKTDGYTCPKCGASFDSNQLARALKQIEGSFARFSDS